jgi:hypothetical protein
MKTLPLTENAHILRTDFSDNVRWEQVCATIREPNDGFVAYVEFVDDPDFEDYTIEQIIDSLPDAYEASFIIVVDHFTMEMEDNPVLVIDLLDEEGRSFRALPSQVQSIESNLSIANMDFYEFAEAVDEETEIFRGFPEIEK